MRSKSNPFIFLLLVVMALVFVFPFVYLIGGSLKSNQEALTSPASVFPLNYTSKTLQMLPR